MSVAYTQITENIAALRDLARGALAKPPAVEGAVVPPNKAAEAAENEIIITAIDAGLNLLEQFLQDVHSIATITRTSQPPLGGQPMFGVTSGVNFGGSAGAPSASGKTDP